MSILLSVIVAFVSAVSPSAMPNNYHAVNIVYASQKNTLTSSVLAVENVPETPALKIAFKEKEGEKIAEEFPEILNRVAFCESGGKHFDEKGQVIRGKQNPNDIGKWQINIFYHWETANKLGYDIFTEEGNEGYALWLYKKNGMRDWEYSKNCWLQTSS